ncbi:MAG TPA: heparin lyase I family protein [Thermoleophilaceae bacterium]|nr:heparin lyase I family protein [Thermoleophilaceae bacterium]
MPSAERFGYAVTEMERYDVAPAPRTGAYVLSSARSRLTLRRVHVRTRATAAAVSRLLTKRARDGSSRRVLAARRAGRDAVTAVVLTVPRSAPRPTKRQLARLRRLARSLRGGSARRLSTRDRDSRAPKPGRGKPPRTEPVEPPTTEPLEPPTTEPAEPPASEPVEPPTPSEPVEPPTTPSEPAGPPTTPPDSLASGQLLFEDRFDSGSAGEGIWGPKQAAPGSLDYVESPVFPGRSKAMRNRLEPGDLHAGTNSSRSELTGSLKFRDGDVRWFRMPVRFNEWSLQSGAWALIWQAHSGSGSPPLAAYVQSDELLFRVKNGYTGQIFWEQKFELHRWYDLVIGTQFSHGGDGWVEVWVDGVRQKLRNGQQRMTGATLSPTSSYSYDKLGLYQASSFSSGARELLHGMYKVGTTRESVVR